MWRGLLGTSKGHPNISRSKMNIMNDLRAYTAKELLRMPFDPWEYVLEPWLRTEETAVIWAASGLGKTWMSLSIALAVAGGGRIGEWTAPKARKVLYIDGEMNLRDLRDRIRDLLNGGAVEVPDRELAESNLEIIARQAQEIGQGFLDLTNADHQAGILEGVRRKAVELVIFDNLTTLSEGLEDENDAGQFKPLQGLFMQLKAAKVGAILIHHANKSHKQMRGSTALETTFEVIIGLKRPDVWTAHRGATFDLEFTKFRGERDDRTDSKTWSLLKGSGWELAKAESEEAKDLPAVRLLKTGQYTTQAEIAKELDVDPGTVSRQLQKAVDAGVLTETNKKRWFAIGMENRSGGGGGDLLKPGVGCAW